MKVGVVNGFRANLNKTPQNYRALNMAVSFRGNAASDNFKKQETSLNLEELLNKRNELFEEIKAQVASHQENTKKIGQKVFKIQKEFDDKSGPVTFREFRETIQQEDILPLKKAYSVVDNQILSMLQLRRGLFEEDGCGFDGGYIFFESKDKALADEVASLYPFYSKARFDQKEVCNDASCFEQAFSYGYYFNNQEFKSSACDIDTMQKDLIKALDRNCETYKKEKRPNFLVVNELDSLINENLNSKPNIAEMKFVLNSSVEDYGRTVILAGTKDARAPEFDLGTIMANRQIRVVKLDEFNITKEQVDKIKKSQKELASTVGEIEEVYKTITQQDKDRIRHIEKLIRDYSANDDEIIKLIPDENLKSVYKTRSSAELEDLVKNRATLNHFKKGSEAYELIFSNLFEVETKDAINNFQTAAKTNKYLKALAAFVAVGCSALGAFYFYKKHSKTKIQN